MASIQDSPVKKKKRRKRKTPLGKRCMIHVFEKNPGKMTAFTNVSWKVHLICDFHFLGGRVMSFFIGSFIYDDRRGRGFNSIVSKREI